MIFKTFSLFVSLVILALILVQTLPSSPLYGRRKTVRKGSSLKGTTPLEARFFSDLEECRSTCTYQISTYLTQACKARQPSSWIRPQSS